MAKFILVRSLNRKLHLWNFFIITSVNAIQFSSAQDLHLAAKDYRKYKTKAGLRLHAKTLHSKA